MTRRRPARRDTTTVAYREVRQQAVQLDIWIFGGGFLLPIIIAWSFRVRVRIT